MTAPKPDSETRMGSLSKDGVSLHEHAVEDTNREWIQEYPLLVGKTPEELNKLEKSLKKRLDYIFLPMVTMVLFMGYLERVNVGQARIAGMQKDLGMSDEMWSLGISAYYIGYIISQLPATIWLAKGLPRYQIPCYVIAWSSVTACMSLMKAGWAFVLCRFLVGFAEGPFLPIVSLMTSSWYTKQEAPLRMAIWHAGNVGSSCLSGLLAAGIQLGMEGTLGIRGWKWFLIIEGKYPLAKADTSYLTFAGLGCFGVLVGLIGFWGLPNFPHNHGTTYLTDEMAEMAAYRMKVSAGGLSEDDEGGAWEGVRLACKDPLTWLYTVIHFGIILAISYKDFFPSIVATLGYSDLMTYLIQAPPYLFAYIFVLAMSWSVGRTMEHCWHIIATGVFGIIGVIVMIATLNPGARYFGMFLMVAGPFAGVTIHVPWETTNVPRPRTKRGALIAITNCVATVSHWFSPYFFLRSQEPRYQNAGGLIIAGAGLGIIGCLATKWYCRKKNKQLAAYEAANDQPKGWRYVE